MSASRSAGAFAVASARPAGTRRGTWAVQALAVRPTDRLLEIGCGRGVAVDLVCQRLGSGHIVAIDRSRSMLRLAEQRNARHVAAGKAAFRLAAAESYAAVGETYDKIFAINVNLFSSPASAGLIVDRVRDEWLAPGGALFLIHEVPGLSRARAMAAQVMATLSGQGLRSDLTVATAGARRWRTCVVARPATTHPTRLSHPPHASI